MLLIVIIDPLPDSLVILVNVVSDALILLVLLLSVDGMLPSSKLHAKIVLQDIGPLVFHQILAGKLIL